MEKIYGDGNCFYRSLSMAMNGTERYYKNYRKIIIDYIEYRKEELKDFFTDDEESNSFEL